MATKAAIGTPEPLSDARRVAIIERRRALVKVGRQGVKRLSRDTLLYYAAAYHDDTRDLFDEINRLRGLLAARGSNGGMVE